MTIYRWIVCTDPDSISSATHLYNSFDDARDCAIAQKTCVIEVSFVYEDSELVQDYREAVA